MKLGRFASGAAALLVVSWCVAVPERAVHADVQTFAVTNNLDDGSAGSLRAAIQNANNLANDPAGPDRIQFAPGLGPIVLTSALAITDSIEITGTGADELVIDGGGANRIFEIGHAADHLDVLISGVTLTGGFRGDNGGLDGGGAILAGNTSLTLDGVTISANHSFGPGGAVYVRDGDSSLNVTNSTILDNTADTAPGGIAVDQITGDVVITNTTLAGNSGSDGAGGMIVAGVGGVVTIDQSTFANNVGDFGGGAYLAFVDGAVTVEDSLFTGNVGPEGASALTISGFLQQPTVSRTDFVGNAGHLLGTVHIYRFGVDPDDPPGSLIEDSTFVDNRGNGIVYTNSDGPDVISRTSVTRSMIADGPEPVPGPTGGAVVDMLSTRFGSLTVDRSTLANNAETGIFLWATAHPVVVSNSTVSGNNAADAVVAPAVRGLGGGISGVNLWALTNTTVTVDHSTIVGNSAERGGGIGLAVEGSPLRLINSIVADNTATQDGDDIAIIDATVPMSVVPTGPMEADYSFFNDYFGPGPIVGANNLSGDPLLAPLADNDGPTLTHRPSEFSPVINAGDPAYTGPPDVDQRGADRVLGGVTDIGAVEVVGPPVDDTYATTRDTPLSVPAATGVLANDADGSTAVALVDGPLNGTVTLNADGSFTYHPADGFVGSDWFDYRISSEFGPPEVARVTIQVVLPNNPPVAVDDVAAATAGGDPVAIDVLANDSDADDDPLSIVSVTQPASGSVSVIGGSLEYTPGDEVGEQTFSYTITDGTATATALVRVAVAPPATTTTTTTTTSTTTSTTIAASTTTTTTIAGPTTTFATTTTVYGGPLPETGGQVGRAVEFAALFLVGGLALVVTARRRTAHTGHS